MKVFSSGGGVQSTAVLVLAARGVLDYSIFVFANTGDDSEHPDTLEYVRDTAMPYATKKGIQFVEVSSRSTLLEAIYRRKRSVPIPARMSNGAPGNRGCTVDFKIRQVDKWIGQNGGRGNTVKVGLGISTDEIHRARRKPPERTRSGFVKVLEYPLIDLGMSRSDCQKLIGDEGLPPVPKSACYFCPFHTPTEWIRLRNRSPILFEKSVEIERHINHKREAVLQKDKVWLHPALIPLDQAVGQQMSFDDLDNCESGYCFT